MYARSSYVRPEPTTLSRMPERAFTDASSARALGRLLLVRRAAITMLLIGALNLYAAMILPKPDHSDRLSDFILATLLVLAAVAVAVSHPERTPRFAALLELVVPFYAVADISGIAATGRPIGSVPFFYLWPVMLVAYFHSRRVLASVLGWVAVSFAAALPFAEADVKLILYAGVVSSVTLVGVVVLMMRENQERLMRRQDELLDELYRMSTIDPLTNTLNRRAFVSAFAQAAARAKRAGVALSLALFDLDHFKSVNDKLGHAEGDEALRRFAQVTASECRRTDVIARMGGEEFAVILFGSDLDQAHAFAERVGRRLHAETADRAASLSVSAGVATLTAQDRSAEQLLARADRALYAAKAAGRARTARWDHGVMVGAPRHGDDGPVQRLAASGQG
jgi:diguanylate cyclase (GGDEF)-like protein